VGSGSGSSPTDFTSRWIFRRARTAEGLAEELGIVPLTEEKVQTGAGQPAIKRGRAVVRIAGKEKLQPVWISHVVDKVLVGAITTGTLGIRINPVTGRIEEVPLMLY
jgi:predicted aspartyl protease